MSQLSEDTETKHKPRTEIKVLVSDAAKAYAKPGEAWCQDELQLLLTILACQSWKLSSCLHKVSSRVALLRTTIESYVHRLQDYSTFFLCVRLRLNACIEKGICDSSAAMPILGFRVCSDFLEPFEVLHWALSMYTGSFKLGKPVIKAISYKRTIIDPFTKDGLKNLEEALVSLGKWTAWSTMWIKLAPGKYLEPDFELDGQVLIELGQNPHQKKYPGTDVATCEPAMIGNMKKETCASTKFTYGATILGITHLFEPFRDVGLSTCEADTQKKRRNSQLGKLERRNRNWPDNASKPLKAENGSAYSGTVLLQAELLVSCGHGRRKKCDVILFDHRLVFYRRATDCAIVQCDIPFQCLLLVVHRIEDLNHSEEMGSGVLTIYWDAELDGPHEISGVEIFFDNVATLRSWAKPLVRAVALQSSPEGKGIAKSSEKAELGHEGARY